MPITNKKTLFIILIGLGIADFLGAIDSTGVNIALPQIINSLKMPVSYAGWIPSSYLIAVCSTLIFFGRIGDIIGPKKLYLTGLFIFGIASIGLGFVNIPWIIILLRVVQGIGTSILYTMPMSIIAHLWQEREKAFAVTASFFATGMLVGPIIGGVLADVNIWNFYGWHWLFLINVPLVVVGLIIAQKLIPKIPSQKADKIDYFSLMLLSTGLIVVILSLSVINHWYLLIGLLLLFLLYCYEKRVRQPLLDFQLFSNRTFLSANAVSFLAMVVVIGMSFVLTFYLQSTLGWGSAQAGIALLPVPLTTAIAAALSGKLKSWRLSAIVSSSLFLLGLLILSGVNPEISYFKGVLPALIFLGLGSGVLMTSIFAAIIGSAPVGKSGSASGILNTLQQLGGLIGIALVAGTVLNYSLSFQVLSLAAVFGLIAALFVENSRQIIK